MDWSGILCETSGTGDAGTVISRGCAGWPPGEFTPAPKDASFLMRPPQRHRSQPARQNARPRMEKYIGGQGENGLQNATLMAGAR